MMRFVILAALISVFPVAPAFGQTAQIDLAWDPTTTPDVDNYNIYVGTSPSAQDVGVYTVPGSQTNYTFAATPGILYYFSVTAVNAAGEGPRSAAISGSIPLLVSLVNRTSTVSIPIVALRLTAEDPDGGIVRFSHTGLPPGLVLDSVTGIITGIPLNTGTFRVTVFASDGVLSSSKTFDWTIRAVGSGDTSAPTLSITSPAAGQSLTSSSVTIRGTATDGGTGDSGIVRVTVNGQVATGGTAADGGTAIWSRTLTLSSGSQTVLVEALDGAGNYSGEAITLTRDVTAPALAITSHTSNQTVSSGTITLSGTATDNGNGGNGVTSVTVGGSSASGGTVTGNSTANWSRTVSLAAGVNSLTVAATDGAGNVRSQSISIRYTPPSLSVTSLTSDRSSPQAPGTAIRFTVAAAGGTAPYQFKWWIQSSTGEWNTAQNWSTSSSFTWTPAVAGTYAVAVWARNAGVTADASQSMASVSYVIANGVSSASASTSSATSSGSGAPISVTSLTSDRSSPQAPGTSIQFAVTAAGGTAPYQFKWWVQSSGGAWTVLRDWSTSTSLTWQPTVASTYSVAVWARNAGVTADASQALATVSYTIASSASSGGSSSAPSSGSASTTPLSITSLTTDRPTPSVTGTTIRFTAAAAGGTAPYQFKWWIQSAGGAWNTAQNWSSSPTFTWQPSVAGTYSIAIWARNAGVTADASQALASATFVIVNGTSGSGSSTSAPAPVSITSLTSDRSSPRLAGSTIRFTATAAGGTAPYQFKWWILSNGQWNTVQNWSTSSTFTWRPAVAGTYTVAVWVRNAGVTADASQAFAQVPFIISP